MKIALILFLTVGFVGCSYTGLNLPLRVTEKKVADGGTCSTTLGDEQRAAAKRGRDYETS